MEPHRLLFHEHAARIRRDLEEPANDETGLNRIRILRKLLSQLSELEAMELLVEKLSKTKTNEDFLAARSKEL